MGAYGIPGEDPAEYARMATMIPLLIHLKPPNLAHLQIERFSPYFRCHSYSLVQISQALHRESSHALMQIPLRLPGPLARLRLQKTGTNSGTDVSLVYLRSTSLKK